MPDVPMEYIQDAVGDPAGKHVVFAWSFTQRHKVIGAVRVPEGSFSAAKKVISGSWSREPSPEESNILFDGRSHGEHLLGIQQGGILQDD